MAQIVRRVLVTGSSRGIGREIALELGRLGFAVTVHCLKEIVQAEETVRELISLGSQSYTLQFDVCDHNLTVRALSEDIEKHGAYYGVVCNAGVTRDAPFPSLSFEDWNVVINTNLNSFFNVLRPLVMPMIQLRCGGRIVTLSSLAGIAGNRGQVHYAAAKAGIIGATKSLAKELAKREITVNCVAPGLVESDMTKELPIDEILREIPMRRLGTPAEVAASVGFLFSERAAYLTGQVISLNGGLL